MSREAYPDLIQALSDFNTTSFTELQAAAYIALLEMGEETGSAVASKSGINRSKIYDILNQLEEMGAVRKVSREKKVKYVAVAPEDLLASLLNRFTSDIESAKDALTNIQNKQEEIDPSKFTITLLDLTEFDVNRFEYLITSNERSRVRFTDKLDKEFKPQTDVKILNLNDRRDTRGMVFLLSPSEAFLFGTPTGMKVDAIHIVSEEICKMLTDIVQQKWTSDLPDQVMEEIESGQRVALTIEKATFVRYEFFPKDQEYRYDRPISVLITDEHISFFYEQNEELKIPIATLSEVTITEEGFLRALFKNKQGQSVGDLRMKLVNNPHYLKNIMLMVARKVA